MIDWIGCKLTKCPYGKEYGNCDTCENLIRKENIVEPLTNEKNEKAREILKHWDGYFVGYSSDDVNEALDMAIKALEQVSHLNDRPCEVCEYHTETGCVKWKCVFER